MSHLNIAQPHTYDIPNKQLEMIRVVKSKKWDIYQPFAPLGHSLLSPAKFPRVSSAAPHRFGEGGSWSHEYNNPLVQS